MKIPTIKLKGITAPASPTKMQDHWGSTISQENRRVTGVTPRAIGLYPTNPARLLPKSKAFKNLAGATKRKTPKGIV